MAYDRLAVAPEFNGSNELLGKFVKSVSAKWSNTVVLPGNYLGLSKDCEHVSAGGKSRNNEVMSRIMMIGHAESWRHRHFLMGPNELYTLYEPEKFFSGAVLKSFVSSWLDPHFVYKTQIAVACHNKLISHGGLTHGLWVELGKPQTAHDAADALNKRFWGKMFFKRSVRIGGSPNYSADPVFAHPFLEFYPSWITSEDKMPFGQIVATKSLNTFEASSYLQEPNTPLYYLTNYLRRRWGSLAVVNGAEVTSVYSPSGYYGDDALLSNESFYTESYHVPNTEDDDTDTHAVVWKMTDTQPLRKITPATTGTWSRIEED